MIVEGVMLNKIRVKVSGYALLDVLRALYCDNVKEVTVTKEDNDLILIVDTSRDFKQQSCVSKCNEDDHSELSNTSTSCTSQLRASGVMLHG